MSGLTHLELPQGKQEHLDSALPLKDTPESVRELPSQEYNTPDGESTERVKPALPDDERDSIRDYKLLNARQAALYSPRMRWKKQRRQRGRQKIKDRRRYMRNRRRTLQKSKLRYRRIKNNPQFKRRNLLRRKNPNRYKRRTSSALIPEIGFVVGPDLQPGFVRDISSLTGQVNVMVGSQSYSLPPMSLLSSVVFMDESGMEEMFRLIDEVVGEAAYEDLCPEDIHGTADLFSVPWDDDSEFMATCERLTGQRHLDDMTVEDLEAVEDGLLNGAFQGKPLQAYWRVAGEIFLVDKEPTPSIRPDDESERNSPADIPEVDDSDWPPSTVKEPAWRKQAATIQEILDGTSRDIHTRSSRVRWRLSRADPKRAIWTFQVQGSSDTYTVRVRGVQQKKGASLGAGQVQVSCSCPFFRWQGPEHHASVNRYLYGRPQGTASKPAAKDPGSRHWACKHVVAVLRVASKYRMASERLVFSEPTEVVPAPPQVRSGHRE